MRSMHQVLLKQKRLLVASEGGTGDPGFAVHLTVSSKLLAQPRQRHDDHTCSAGTLGQRASCGWLNGDRDLSDRHAQLRQVVGRLAVKTLCIPSSRACT